MALFVARNIITESCIDDIQFCLREGSEGGQNFLKLVIDSINDGLTNLKNGGSADGEFVMINKYLAHVSDLSWLEKKQLQLEDKLKKYEAQAASDETGTFKKIWIKIKAFLVKVIKAIVAAINKAHRWVKNKYRDYKLKKEFEKMTL